MEKIFRAGVLTISDKGSRGLRKDESGEIVAGMLESQGYKVVKRATVPDDLDRIVGELTGWIDKEGLNLVVTSGGTGLTPRDITPQAMAVLEGYDWPGNIRELENFLEGVIALIPPGKRIRSIDVEEIKKRSMKSLDSMVQVPEELLNSSYEKAKKCFERYYFLNLLRKNNGNITHSARFAKIHPATLHRKVNKLQIKSIRHNNSAPV